MSEVVRKYFDLEIGDVITFCIGSAEIEYPMTFTVEECIEEYCDMRGLDLVRIIEDNECNTHIRSGHFYYKKHGVPKSFGRIVADWVRSDG